MFKRYEALIPAVACSSPRKLRARHCLVAVALLVLCAACSGAGPESDVEAARPAVPVELTEVVGGPLSEFEVVDGISRAARREYLAFESAGRVVFLKSNTQGGPLLEGDRVKKGELLAQLDQSAQDAGVRAARADLDSARARLSNAVKDYQRAQRLRAGDAIETRRFDAIESAHEQALGDVRSAEARVDEALAGQRQFQLRAPFDGVVAFVNIREGQYIAPGQFNAGSEKAAVRTASIVVIDPEDFEIQVELPGFGGRRIRAGQRAFVLDGDSLALLQAEGWQDLDRSSLIDSMVPGEVSSVSPAVDPGDRSIRARIDAQGGLNKLTDGAHVTTWIEVGRRQQATIAPVEGLVFRGNRILAFVYDRSQGLVEEREIAAGLTGLEGIEVLAGLSPGEMIVTKGRYRLTSGMMVTGKTKEKAVGDEPAVMDVDSP